jgi:2-polyprenyl-3-methyl-5-hydroxy-6-metoxy-1,4-benzoquinol methylase
MDSESNASSFDRYYYEHGLGKPYERNEDWLRFFDIIAQKIATEIQPKTVLDAGCAMGFLVESLRKKDIEAWGIDISEYAINSVYPDYRPFC